MIAKRYITPLALRAQGACAVWAALFILMTAGSARAGSIIFTAGGTFQTGATLSGTVTIDTATGIAQSGDLAVSGISSHFTSLILQRTWPPTSPFLSELIFLNGLTTTNQLILLFPPASLIGYGGGILCGLQAVCQDAQGLHYLSNYNDRDISGASTNFVDMNGGTLSAPEPSTLTMFLASAALGILVMITRRKTAPFGRGSFTAG